MPVNANPSPAFHLAVTQYRLGRLDLAETACRDVLKAQPKHPGALHLLGVISLRRLKPAAAVEWFDRLLKLKPDMPDVLNNRGMALQDLGRPKEALASFDGALKLKPDYAEALTNRGALLAAARRFDDAARTYARLLAVAPDRSYARGALLAARLGMCDWTDFESLSADVAARVERGEFADDPTAFTWHSVSPALQLRAAEIYAARQWPSPPLPASTIIRPERERIRLAYFSGDFREHAVAFNFVNLFERHDRARFEVWGISYGPDDGSPMRARLERAFDRFIDTRAMDDQSMAQMMRREGIDIVVDLTGFTGGNRTAVLAHRPAPIQVNHQLFGTGAPFMDYVVSDATIVPDHLAGFYRERLVRLPDCCMVTDDAQPIAEAPPSRAAEGLPERGFVFACFNNVNKILPPLFAIWMRLLRAVEGSVLWLRQDNALALANLRRAAEQAGIAGERLVFARRVPLPEHLARHRLADLFVDTFPYNAHTTAVHALWAGLPVLSERGETAPSRVATSVLKAVGLPELSVASSEQYEALALDLAAHPERLAALKDKLAHARTTAPLFDSDRYRRHLESAYGTMYRRWRNGQAPASFDVAPEKPSS